MSTVKNDTVEVELFVWMQKVTAKNNGKKYYQIGSVKGIPHTLIVTLVDGNGGAMMFCTKHDEVYPLKGSCAECRNAVVTVAVEAGVTSCDTPEIERN